MERVGARQPVEQTSHRRSGVEPAELPQAELPEWADLRRERDALPVVERDVRDRTRTHARASRRGERCEQRLTDGHRSRVGTCGALPRLARKGRPPLNTDKEREQKRAPVPHRAGYALRASALIWLNAAVTAAGIFVPRSRWKRPMSDHMPVIRPRTPL